MSRCNLFFVDTMIDIGKFRMRYSERMNDMADMDKIVKDNSSELMYRETENPYFGHSLYYYLNDIKKEIDKVSMQWDKYKKITNTYEYIHTNMPNGKMSVCTLKPISRSFFKLIEMIQIFYMMDIMDEKESLRSFHLAEGPGGFIEALKYKRNNEGDEYIGMTLIDSDKNIPGWKKSKILDNFYSNVKLEYGMDGTGDIFNKINYESVVNRYKNSMDIVTADGGFDFTIDFNNQELIATKLIWYELMYGISIQKRGGIFILKVYDIFTRVMVEMLYILSSMYENVQICKPNTSRQANSEKYIYCRGFLLEDSSEYIEKFMELMDDMDENLSSSKVYNVLSNRHILSIIDVNIEYAFMIKLEEINSVLGNMQLENISNTLQLIYQGKENIEYYIKNNIQQCLRWCMKHNMPHVEMDVS